MCWYRYFACRKLLLVIGAIVFSKKTLVTYQGKMFKWIFFGCTKIKHNPFCCLEYVGISVCEVEPRVTIRPRKSLTACRLSNQEQAWVLNCSQAMKFQVYEYIPKHSVLDQQFMNQLAWRGCCLHFAHISLQLESRSFQFLGDCWKSGMNRKMAVQHGTEFGNCEMHAQIFTVWSGLSSLSRWNLPVTCSFVGL